MEPVDIICRSLPNDTCVATKTYEQRLIETEDISEFDPTNHGGTIIYSRTQNKHYVLGKDIQLTSNLLKDYFKTTGHTIGIDYEKTYIRNLAFDIDCLCRRDPSSSHCDEAIVRSFCEQLKEYVLEYKLSKLNDLFIVIWNSNYSCGYHVYTNVVVSLPLHLQIGKIMEQKFIMSSMIVEVPAIMPLPYSAKKTSEMYENELLFHNNFILDLNVLPNAPYFDIFDYNTKYKNTDLVAGNIIGREQFYILYTPIYKTSSDFKIRNISEHSMTNNFAYMEQFIKFLNNFTLTPKKLNSTDVLQRVKYFLHSYSAIESSFFEFISKFNNGFYRVDSDDPEYFIKTSLDLPIDDDVTSHTFTNYDFNLQHYIVMMHMHLNKHITDVSVFKMLIVCLYKNHMDKRSVKAVINNYNLFTFNSYTTCADVDFDFIFNYLRFMHINKLAWYMSNEEKMAISILSSMGCGSKKNIIEKLTLKPANTKFIKEFVDSYVDILYSLHILFHSEDVKSWYLYNESIQTYSVCKIDTKDSNAELLYGLPLLTEWFNIECRSISFLVINSLLANKKKFNVFNKFCQSKLMFITSVGTWNSVSSTYVANSPMLRFEKSRKCSVWPENDINNANKVVYGEQNNDILKTLEAIESFGSIITDIQKHGYNTKITELFIHFHLIPAFKSLVHIHSIESHEIIKMFDMLYYHKDFSSAYSLVEDFSYLPIEYIYVLMNIEHQITISNCFSYTGMKCKIFSTNAPVNKNDWTEKFKPHLNLMKYDSTQNTFMGKLKSITDEKLIYNQSEEYCFFIVLLGVCLSKCHDFKPLIEAFIPKQQPCPPTIYSVINTDVMKDFYKKAINTVFGEMNTFENGIANAIMMLCLSVSFNQDNLLELVCILSYLYTPRNEHKKMFILYGEKSTGKTFWLDVIQNQSSPSCARVPSLSDLNRTNPQFTSNVLIINEASNIDINQMKSITGSDSETCKIFYTQNSDLKMNQALLFGATNSLITFVKNANDDVQTAVDRLHSIKLTGKHIAQAPENSNLFSIMAASNYFISMSDFNANTITPYISWLCYSFFSKSHTTDYNLVLNYKNIDVLEYKDRVWTANDPYYQIIKSIGVTYKEGCVIGTSEMRKLVNEFYKENRINGKKTKISPSSFFENFNNGDFSSSVIKNYIKINLYNHIQSHMETIYSAKRAITIDELDNRLEFYTDYIDRSNARILFKQKNVFDETTQTFPNKMFTNDAISYSGNNPNYQLE